MQISEGDGWRLQLDARRRPYTALIGGLDWAIELDPRELSCLRRGVQTLLAQRRQLQSLLMPEEDLDLELDLRLPATDGNSSGHGSLFVALCGTAERWSLRFVLTPADGSRAAEGAWTPAASAAMAAALEGLGDGADGG
jgi:hypothetical protein